MSFHDETDSNELVYSIYVELSSNQDCQSFDRTELWIFVFIKLASD